MRVPREDTTIEVLRALKPAFKKDGTVTAGNAPGVNDGAAAVVVTSAKRAKELGAKPMVRIVAQATSGVEPKWVMMAPVGAVQQIWEKTGWKNEDVDLYELNEAFSVQALGVMRELETRIPIRSMLMAAQSRSAIRLAPAAHACWSP